MLFRSAVFRCKRCGHTANADLNAALNIALVGYLLYTVYGVVDASSSDGGAVVIPKIPAQGFKDLYGSRTVDHVCTRQNLGNIAVAS